MTARASANSSASKNHWSFGQRGQDRLAFEQDRPGPFDRAKREPAVGDLAKKFDLPVGLHDRTRVREGALEQILPAGTIEGRTEVFQGEPAGGPRTRVAVLLDRADCQGGIILVLAERHLDQGAGKIGNGPVVDHVEDPGRIDPGQRREHETSRRCQSLPTRPAAAVARAAPWPAPAPRPWREETAAPSSLRSAARSSWPGGSPPVRLPRR